MKVANRIRPFALSGQLALAVALSFQSSITCAFAAGAAPPPNGPLADCNVVWDSPSRDSFDSMPLSGGRGAGANVWFQDGALWLYLGHNAAYSADADPTLLKLGALRVTPVGADFKGAKSFKQELDLASGSIRVAATSPDGVSVAFRLWFAGETLVIESEHSTASELLVEYASWRAKPDLAASADEQVQPTHDALTFVHRNGKALGVEANAKRQGIPIEAIARPTANRVFGGALAARGGLRFARPEAVKWQIWSGYAWPARTIAAKEHVLVVALGSAKDAAPETWIARARELLQPAALDKARHAGQQRWDEFWGRSHVFICAGAPTTNAAAQVGRNYQRFRYMTASNQAGELPLKFNGGIFATDPRIERIPARLNNPDTLSFSRGENPDFLRWGNLWLGQNQRWLGWPTIANGDADLLAASRAFYRDRLPAARARAHHLKADGACYIEAIDLHGLCNVEPDARSLCGARHLTYHLSMGLEHAWMTMRGHDVLGGDILPDLAWMVEQIRFFDSFYRAQTKARTGKELTDAGRLCLYPCNGLELVAGATNPAETVAALRRVVQALLRLPELSPADRAFLERVQPTLPEIPTTTRNGEKVIALADKWEALLNPWELPELYAAWPYRFVGVLHPETLPLARATWKSQDVRGDKRAATPFQTRDWSWMPTLVDMAALGLTEEAAQRAIAKMSDQASCCRFPAFFGPGHDWLPDHNWGGSGMIGLQEMLLACDDDRILLLPAWPKDWDVDFKLQAPKQTVIECKVKGGKLAKLKVTPESRRKDVTVPKTFALTD